MQNVTNLNSSTIIICRKTQSYHYLPTIWKFYFILSLCLLSLHLLPFWTIWVWWTTVKLPYVQQIYSRVSRPIFESIKSINIWEFNELLLYSGFRAAFHTLLFLIYPSSKKGLIGSLSQTVKKIIFFLVILNMLLQSYIASGKGEIYDPKPEPSYPYFFDPRNAPNFSEKILQSIDRRFITFKTISVWINLFVFSALDYFLLMYILYYNDYSINFLLFLQFTQFTL